MSLFGKIFGGRPGLDWLIVGLGNPGRKYFGTRHNAGAMVLTALAKDHFNDGLEELHQDHKFLGQVAKGRLAGRKVMLVFPQTYMNLSGNSVAAAAQFFKMPAERILVVFDDKDLPLGTIRLRAGGSAGGHNGMKSVIERLGTDRIPRLRIGIGNELSRSGRSETADFVLGHPSDEERSKLGEAVSLAAKAVEAVMEEGVERAMDRFN